MPLIKAAIEHKGAAFIDVISPCVAFNNHAGSTKSFDYVREHNEAVNRLDVMTGRDADPVDYAPGTVQTGRAARRHARSRCARSMPITTCTTGSRAMTFLQQHAAKGQIVTGLLYVDPMRKTCTPTSTRSRRRSTRSARRSCARALPRWKRSTPACGDRHVRRVTSPQGER